MSSAFSKSSFLVCTQVHEKTAFSKSATLESVVEKFRFHCIRYVWTEAVSVKKKLRFQMKTNTCINSQSSPSTCIRFCLKTEIFFSASLA